MHRIISAANISCIMYSAKNWLGISLSSLLLLTACHKNTSTPGTSNVGNWVNRYEMNGNVRSEAVGFVIGDTAYVGSGFDGTERLNDYYAFNPATNSWYQIANFGDSTTVPRNSAVAFTAAGKGYVGTGFDGINKLKDFWQYDPSKNTWTRKADFGGSARYDAVAFALNDKGYVTTGFDGSYLKDFWKYDPTTDTWSQQPDGIGTKRSAAVAFVYNNVAYVATGTNNGQLVNDFWKYDGTAWTEMRKITNISTDSYDDDYSDIVRSNAAAFVMGDTAFISTGENSGYISKTWAYLITTDLWIRRTAFEGASRSGAVGFTAQGRGYITCGRSSSNYFDDVYEFHPDEAYNAND